MENNREKGYWNTVIRPKKGWFDIDLKGVVQYRDLIWMMIKRNFTIMYRQTILGPAWVIIQPLLTTLIFTVVFGSIAGLPTDGLPHFMFYMAGSILWHYFANCLTSTSKTFVENRNLFGKVYFPRLCMPIATVCSELINFFVQFALFLIFLIFYACRPNPAVHPNWRLILLVTFGVQLWMYATPVTYSSSMIADKFPNLLGLYMLNPITPIIELFRAAFLGVADYSLKYNALSMGVTLLVAALGVVLFSHTEKTFMDTV